MKTASINILSSRHLCIGQCLKSLWNNYNNQMNYPVHVYYFDDIYTTQERRYAITSLSDQDVTFVQLEYQSPKYVPENEMFYSRADNAYARSFGIRRKGYLHMCNFVSNMHTYPGSLSSKYNYTIVHDDESGYRKSMTIDPVEVMERSGQHIGAFVVGQRLKEGLPHQGHLDTRVGLWELTKKFIEDTGHTPENPKLRSLMTDSNAAWNFHFLDWCDTYVINNLVFESPLWKEWIRCVNESGGIYKYRWGDNEIISLFANMTQPGIVNLGLVADNIHDQGMFRSLQDIAPGVRNNNV